MAYYKLKVHCECLTLEKLKHNFNLKKVYVIYANTYIFIT